MTMHFCEGVCINGCLPHPSTPSLTSSPATSSSFTNATHITNNIEAIMTCIFYICGIDIAKNETADLLQIQQSFTNSNQTQDSNGSCQFREPYLLEVQMPARYAVPINGYLAPVLVLLTIINNTLVCVVLLKPHMRSPTNAILVAMALSDMLTGLFPVPFYIHFFATERFHDWVPYEWVYAYTFFSDFVPTIFHTASIWLTMALAIQRYIYVCHSFKARTWCTVRNVIYGTTTIYILSILSHFSRFLESYPLEVFVPSRLDPGKMVSACLTQYRQLFQDNLNLYFNCYYWFRVVFIHFVPCVSLVVMNALLIYAMKMAQIRRMQLLRQNKKTESRKLKESNCTTLMLVAVVGLFLLVEFPLAVLIIIHIVRQTFNVVIIETSTFMVLSLFSNFFILLSYPLNFFIYCGMSKQFRETFKRIFTGSDIPMDKEYSQYLTLPTENGKSTAVTATAGDETAL